MGRGIWGSKSKTVPERRSWGFYFYLNFFSAASFYNVDMIFGGGGGHGNVQFDDQFAIIPFVSVFFDHFKMFCFCF